jgi:transcriptional regulator with XRE-family HTH domain
MYSAAYKKQGRGVQMKFAETVRELRLKRGLTQEEVAAIAEVHRNYYGEVERGLRNVSLENILRIAKALKVPPAKLFEKYR